MKTTIKVCRSDEFVREQSILNGCNVPKYFDVDVEISGLSIGARAILWRNGQFENSYDCFGIDREGHWIPVGGYRSPVREFRVSLDFMVPDIADIDRDLQRISREKDAFIERLSNEKASAAEKAAAEKVAAEKAAAEKAAAKLVLSFEIAQLEKRIEFLEIRAKQRDTLAELLSSLDESELIRLIRETIENDTDDRLNERLKEIEDCSPYRIFSSIS